MVDKKFISSMIRKYSKKELNEFVNELDNPCKTTLLQMLDRDTRKKVIGCIKDLKVV